MSNVTRILNAIEKGDAKANDELLPLVYETLRHLAAQKMAGGKPGQTLQATALVPMLGQRRTNGCNTGASPIRSALTRVARSEPSVAVNIPMTGATPQAGSSEPPLGRE